MWFGLTGGDYVDTTVIMLALSIVGILLIIALAIGGLVIAWSKDFIIPYCLARFRKKVLALIFSNDKTIKFKIADTSKFIISVEDKAYIWTQDSVWHIGPVPVVILYEPFPSILNVAAVKVLEYLYYKDKDAFMELINELYEESQNKELKITFEDVANKLAEKLGYENIEQIVKGFSVSPDAVFRYLLTGISAVDVKSAIDLEAARRARLLSNPWRLDVILPAAGFALLAIAIFVLGGHVYDTQFNKLPECQKALADCHAKLDVAKQVCNLPWEKKDLNAPTDVNKKTPPMRGGSHPIR
jgi:hypothetical protein